jgi:hypothetical protein
MIAFEGPWHPQVESFNHQLGIQPGYHRSGSTGILLNTYYVPDTPQGSFTYVSLLQLPISLALLRIGGLWVWRYSLAVGHLLIWIPGSSPTQ